MFHYEFLDKDEKARFAGGWAEKALLRSAWQGEILGVGLLETLAEKFPEHAKPLIAGATMEWLNVKLLEDYGHAGGIHISQEEATKLVREGAAFGRKLSSWDFICKLMIAEAKLVLPMFSQ